MYKFAVSTNLKLLIFLISGVLVIAVFLMLCSMYCRYYHVEWNEEVLLEDGRVIIVHVKNTYERKDQWPIVCQDNCYIFRVKELSFEPENAKRIVVKTQMDVAYIGQFGKSWYLVVYGQGPYWRFTDETPFHWGGDFSMLLQRLAILKGDRFVPISWDNAPVNLNCKNLIDSAFYPEFDDWDGGVVTLSQKQIFNKEHSSPNQMVISRPARMGYMARRYCR